MIPVCYTRNGEVCLCRGLLWASKPWNIYRLIRGGMRMALRSDELHYNLQHLNGMLTTREAAEQLRMSYWHFMHLVESGRISGVRIVDRWLFSPTDLDEYRRRKYGELEDMARLALESSAIELTEK